MGYRCRCNRSAIDGWCGACYCRARGREGLPRRAVLSRPLSWIGESEWCLMQKPSVSGSVTPGSELVTGGTFEASWPSLWQYMVDASWEDGSVRELATLLLFVDQDQAKACLNDKGTGRVAFVAAASPLEALDRLEGQLNSQTVDWRPSASKPRAGRR